jgi:hypothetical protein
VLLDVYLCKGINRKSPSNQSIRAKYQPRSGPGPLQPTTRRRWWEGWSGVDRPLGLPASHLVLLAFSFHVVLAGGLPMTVACGLATKIVMNLPPLAPPPQCLEACKETQLHSISTVDPMMVWSKGHGEEAHRSLPWHVVWPPFILSTYKRRPPPPHLRHHNTTQRESQCSKKREQLHSYLSSLARSSVGSESEWRSTRIFGSSPLVPLLSKSYLEYKVCVYLW